MDVRLPDGTVIKGVPDNMSRADLTAKLAKNGYDVSKLNAAPKFASPWDIPSTPAQPKTPQQQQADAANAAALGRDENLGMNGKPDTLAGKVLGSTIEPVAALGTGMLGSLVGNIVGAGSNILNGTYGTKEGIDAAHQKAQQVAQAMTFQPRTATGNKVLGAIGTGIEKSGIAGVPITGQLSSLAGPAMSQVRGVAATANAGINAADDALRSQAGAGTLADLVRGPKPAGMAGVGAAATAEETLRAQRFAKMRAPMQPTKGILSRSMDDVQFEREAAKRPEGKALDNRFAELNKGMEQHMDALAEETGATASSARQTGKAVVNALEMKRAAKKAEISAAYKEAEKSGALAEQVDIKPLLDFVEKNRSAASTANIVTAIEKEVNRLSNGTGKMSINDMEQLRKMTNTLSEPGTPNGAFGKQAIQTIDDATAGKGGPAYQQARRLYENYANEFKNRDVIDKLLRTKRGTKDRAVATEDVADHILFDGSLDDMKHAFRVLEAHPAGTAPEIVAAGQQAANELRGAAIAKMKERMFSNAGADSSGRVVGSEAQIKRIVAELDRDGKLEPLFGKKGAEEIRDTVKVATDLYSTPKGSVNSSNTASAMEKVMNKFEGMFGGTPIAGHAIKYAAKKVESRAMSKKVNAALNPNPPPTQPRTLGDMTGDQ